MRITINPLSKKESLDYIEYRLRMVGRSSAGIFSPQALSLIVEKARGIPRLLNIICDNALFAGYKASVRRIEANLIEEIIINLEGPDYKPKIKKKPPIQCHLFEDNLPSYYQRRIDCIVRCCSGSRDFPVSTGIDQATDQFQMVREK